MGVDSSMKMAVCDEHWALMIKHTSLIVLNIY